MTIKEVKTLLKEHGIHATKDRGQNFLLDDMVIQEMVDIGDVQETDLVVEIGPGFGVLTKALAPRSKRLLAIELDKKLAAHVKRSIVSTYSNIDLIEGDALSGQTYHQLTGWLAHQQGITLGEDVKSDTYQEAISALDQSYKLIANLPYQITSRLLRQFLESFPRPSHMVVMVQKEVAERMMAEPGQMSLLALSVQAYSTPSLDIIVPAASFFPQPKVDSAVIHLDITQPNEYYWGLSLEERARFWQIAKIGFASKRKMLKKNLASLFTQYSVDEIGGMLEEIGVTPTARAQELSIKNWCELTKKV